MNSSTLNDLILAIIKSQEEIIGPMAWVQAENISGLIVDAQKSSVSVTSNTAVDELVKSYRDFFGEAAVEVCRSALRKLETPINGDDIPKSLR